MVIILVMLIGGSSGSTASGIKVFRVGVMLKSLYWSLRKMSSPHLVLVKRFGEQKFNDDQIKSIMVFIILYLLFIVIGVGVLLSQGYPMTESIFDVVSAQGNMGLSMGLANGDMVFIGKVMLTKVGLELSRVCNTPPVNGFFDYVKKQGNNILDSAIE